MLENGLATYQSAKTDNNYSSLNRELRWLWNSVYLSFIVSQDYFTHFKLSHS